MNDTRDGDPHVERPEVIEARISRTRAEMDTTLNAIENRLTPGQLFDEGMNYLRASPANEFIVNLGGSVKRNPMPVALMGISLAWLMMTSRDPRLYRDDVEPYARDSSGASNDTGLGDRAREAAGSLSERTHAAGAAVSDKARAAGQSLSDTAHSMGESITAGARSVSESARSAGRSLSETASAASQRVGRMTDSARETARRAREGTVHQVQRAREGYQYMLREQPLALGAIGIALGALLAAALPRTRQEDEWLGDASDRVTDKAREAASERFDRVKEVATVAKDAAMGEAERQGLPTGEPGPSGTAETLQPERDPHRAFDAGAEARDRPSGTAERPERRNGPPPSGYSGPERRAQH